MIKYDEEIFYFQCIPPRPSQKEASPETSERRYAREDPFLASVYFHWWRFLRASPDYAHLCDLRFSRHHSSEVVDHFGDLRQDADFEAWWIKCGRHLFCEPRELTIGTLDPQSWPSHPDPIWLEGRLIVTLPIDGDADRTLAEVRAVLGTARKKGAKRGRNKSMALFQPFTTKFDVEALDRIFRIWDFQRLNDSMALYDIAKEFGAREPEIEAEKYDWRIARTNEISRDLRSAKCLMKYAALGAFPVMNEQAADRVEEHLDAQKERLKSHRA